MKKSILFLSILLTSCNSYKLAEKRLNRYQKEYPQLFKTDTVFVNDTVITKETRKDTAFFYNQKDTVLIQKGNLLVKYFYTRDSVYLQGKCLPDTFIKKIPITVNTKIKPIDRKKDILTGFFIGLVSLLILFFSYKYLKNILT